MKTNKKLIIQTLIYLKDGNHSLEEACNLAKKKIQLPFLDEIDVIRSELVALKLLNHNLRIGNYVENRQGIITFPPDFILQKSCEKDFLTEKCLALIKNGSISSFDFDTYR